MRGATAAAAGAAARAVSPTRFASIGPADDVADDVADDDLEGQCPSDDVPITEQPPTKHAKASSSKTRIKTKSSKRGGGRFMRMSEEDGADDAGTQLGSTQEETPHSKQATPGQAERGRRRSRDNSRLKVRVQFKCRPGLLMGTLSIFSILAGMLLLILHPSGNVQPLMQPWDRCYQPWGCHTVSDRISVMSVSQSSAPDWGGGWPLFSKSLAGFILDPKLNNLMCSYPYDAGTAERKCNPIGMSNWCFPGCTYFGSNHWCNEKRGWPCAWPTDHLSESLQIRERIAQAGGDTWERDCPWNFVKEGGYYNELVFEYDAFAANLPHSIAAIFYMKDDSCWDKRPQNWLAQQTTTKCADYARWAHAQLLERWPVEAADIPLVVVDPWHFGDAPFSLAE